MYKIALLTALLYPFTIAAVANAQMTETKVEWLRDIDEARMVAANSHRDVFVLFTGRGWCQPCEMLDQLLFHDAKFVSRLQELCVPVELDFNFGDTDVEKVREARFRNLAKRYLVLGYPTMVLMDSDGQPFFVAEYPVGDPAKFIARIERAIAKKNERQKLCLAPLAISPNAFWYLFMFPLQKNSSRSRRTCRVANRAPSSIFWL